MNSINSLFSRRHHPFALQAYSTEAIVAALTVGFISQRLFLGRSSLTTTMSSIPVSSTRNMIAVKEVQPSDVFTQEELATIKAAYQDDEVEGKFMRGRHGVTHFILEEPSSLADDAANAATDEKGVVVVIHGLGVSMKMYQSFARMLVKEGYSVLRYDLFGHGYSRFINDEDTNDIWVQMTPDILVDQLEDVIGLVCSNGSNKVHSIVGHSLGGIAAISAKHRWDCENTDNKTFDISNIVLVNPALWATKPFMAKVADKIPSLLTSIMKNIPPTRAIVGDSYMEAGEIAFGRDPSNHKVIAKDAEEKKKYEDQRLFGKVKGVKAHPFLAAGILGANCNTLRGDILPTHIAKLKEVFNASKESDTKVSFLFGELDATVPFKQNIETVKNWEKDFSSLSLTILERIGHEAFYEDSDFVTRSVLAQL